MGYEVTLFGGTKTVSGFGLDFWNWVGMLSFRPPSSRPYVLFNNYIILLVGGRMDGNGCLLLLPVACTNW